VRLLASEPERDPATTPRPPEAPPAADGWVLQLQRSAGNAAVARLLDPVGTPAPGTPDEYPIGEPPVTGRPVSGTPDEYPIDQPPPGRDDGFDHVRLALRDWPKLPAKVQNLFNAPSFDTFVDVRVPFLRTFGFPGVSEDEAYARAIEFYNRIVRVHFMGRPVDVHPDMRDALIATENYLQGQEFKLDSLGGCNIRRNTNNLAVLSDHSYGSAIDINGDTSPNTKRLKHDSERAQLIAAITGIDPTEDSDGNEVDTGERTATEMFIEADRLSIASDRLKAAFQDEISLAICGQGIAEERGDPAGDAGELGPLMFDAAAENVGNWRYEPYEPILEPSKPGKRQRLRPDAAHQELARFVFPVDTGDQSRLWDDQLVRSTVDLLAYMAKVYTQSFSRKTKSGRVAPTPWNPSDAQLAVHGFMNVPPELVAALSGSDAGDLKWLGMMSGATKDYMHFELRDRPALI
jgi:hypothetical protein